LLNTASGSIKRAGRPVLVEDFSDLGRKMNDHTLTDSFILRGPEDLSTTRPKPYRTDPGNVSSLRIVEHSAYYCKEDKESYGVVRLYDASNSQNFWMDARAYLSIDSNTQNLTDSGNYQQLTLYLNKC
jgi:hypothetical protein